jgi:hypothetical protein
MPGSRSRRPDRRHLIFVVIILLLTTPAGSVGRRHAAANMNLERCGDDLVNVIILSACRDTCFFKADKHHSKDV